MAKKSKNANADSATISFSCPAELKDALETFAASKQQDISSLLVKFVEKGTKANSPQITFRCTSEQKEGLEILAASRRKDVSSLLVSLVNEFIAANTERISSFKAQAAVPLNMPTFAIPAAPPQSARPSKKKKPAQVADEVKGGENVAENA